MLLLPSVFFSVACHRARASTPLDQSATVLKVSLSLFASSSFDEVESLLVFVVAFHFRLRCGLGWVVGSSWLEATLQT